MGGKTRKGIQNGAVREGPALLQGLVRCGHCGRSMHISYGGHTSRRPASVYQYRCRLVHHQGVLGPDCQLVGGKRIDQVVVEAFHEATRPAAMDAAREANEKAKSENEAIERYWEYQIEKAEYEVQRAERQYRWSRRIV